MKCTVPKFQLKVLVDEKPVQEYHKDDRVFVEGRKGSRFSLLVKNLCGNRILVHPTVDGLSAMNGKPASRHDNENGYVLPAYAEAVIPGWRLDDAEVAAFYFAGGGDSYAEREGMGENKGVIACAVWDELPHFDFSGSNCPISATKSVGQHTNCCSCNPLRSSRSSRSSGRAGGQSVGNLGTGFGERAEHQVRHTHFTPATPEPVVTAIVFYDDRQGLEARGIRVSKKKKVIPEFPNPFPKSSVGCKPPPGWNG